MTRIAQVLAIAAALAAFPAGAETDEPVPGSDRDPFSQTYTGRDPEEIHAERERELRELIARDRSCACRDDGATEDRPKP